MHPTDPQEKESPNRLVGVDPTDPCPIDLQRDAPHWPLGIEPCWSLGDAPHQAPKNRAPRVMGVHIPQTPSRGDAPLRPPGDGASRVMGGAPH